MNKKFSTVKIAKLAMMVAISCVLVLLVRIPFPGAPFLVYDPADIPIYITTFAFGPIPGLIVTLIVSLIQAFLLGGSGVYGFIMHVLATGIFAIIAGGLYKHKKSKKEAIIALTVGVLLMTAVMVVANIFITPLFMGAPREAVIAMLVPIIIPFNLMKGGVNAIVTFLVYKRISGFLHKD
ncbi:riboflavin transporter FmnP [Clostridiales Family XIII bacterium PM5-7]